MSSVERPAQAETKANKSIYRAQRSASRPKLQKLEQLRSDTRAAETDSAGGRVRRVVEAGFSAVVAVHEVPIGTSPPSAP